MPDLLIEAVGGASGNMLLGALLDLGLARSVWLEALKALPLSPWELVERRVVKVGVAALHVDFEIQQCQRQWTLPQLVEALRALPAPVVSRATQTLERLGQAESLSRGQEVASLCWSDGAASDLLLDIGGFHLGLWLLDIGQFYATPLPLGQGFCLHHGKPVPNPNPVVARLLLGKPQFRLPLHQETITTTGAALLSEATFDLPESLTPHKLGYGAGTSDFPISNVVRLSLLDSPSAPPTELILMETHLDDLNPQLLGLLPDRLIEEGALDAYMTNIQGKKGRPAFKVSLLCESGRREALASYLFRHTTTLGVRSWPIQRITLKRHMETLETPLGELQIKVRQLPDGSRAASVEYESLREIAEKHGLSLLQASARLQLCRELGADGVEGLLQVVDEV